MCLCPCSVHAKTRFFQTYPPTKLMNLSTWTIRGPTKVFFQEGFFFLKPTWSDEFHLPDKHFGDIPLQRSCVSELSQGVLKNGYLIKDPNGNSIGRDFYPDNKDGALLYINIELDDPEDDCFFRLSEEKPKLLMKGVIDDWSRSMIVHILNGQEIRLFMNDVLTHIVTCQEGVLDFRTAPQPEVTLVTVARDAWRVIKRVIKGFFNNFRPDPKRRELKEEEIFCC